MLITPAIRDPGSTWIMPCEEHPLPLGILLPLKYNPPSILLLSLPIGPNPVKQRVKKVFLLTPVLILMLTYE